MSVEELEIFLLMHTSFIKWLCPLVNVLTAQFEERNSHWQRKMCNAMPWQMEVTSSNGGEHGLWYSDTAQEDKSRFTFTETLSFPFIYCSMKSLFFIPLSLADQYQPFPVCHSPSYSITVSQKWSDLCHRTKITCHFSETCHPATSVWCLHV